MPSATRLQIKISKHLLLAKFLLAFMITGKIDLFHSKGDYKTNLTHKCVFNNFPRRKTFSTFSKEHDKHPAIACPRPAGQVGLVEVTQSFYEVRLEHTLEL